MKKIEALKNNETGEIEQPQRMLANKGKAGEALYFYRLTQYPQKDYTPIPCLLIEESELKEKIAFIEDLVNVLATSTEVGKMRLRQDIIDELNSLTK